MSEETNQAWALRQLREARSLERLKYIHDAIYCDVWEKEPYTYLENVMQALRDAYAKRHRELTDVSEADSFTESGPGSHSPGHGVSGPHRSPQPLFDKHVDSAD